jgi:hypothetical protein
MNARFFLLTTLAAVALVAACGPLAAPKDEAWLKITAFVDPATDKDISMLASKLSDAATSDLVNIQVANYTTSAGGGGASTGITVERVNVAYRCGKYTSRFPDYNYRVHVYLPSGGTPSSARMQARGASGVVSDIPVVPAALKGRIAPEDETYPLVPCKMVAAGFNLQAEITLFGRTDEGKKIEVSSILTAVIEGLGGSASCPEPPSSSSRSGGHR